MAEPPLELVLAEEATSPIGVLAYASSADAETSPRQGTDTLSPREAARRNADVRRALHTSPRGVLPSLSGRVRVALEVSGESALDFLEANRAGEAAEGGELLSFASAVPPPAGLSPTKGLGIAEWRRAHWGCTEEASGVGVEHGDAAAADSAAAGKLFRYTLVAADHPPVAWLSEVSAQFAELRFELLWEERGGLAAASGRSVWIGGIELDSSQHQRPLGGAGDDDAAVLARDAGYHGVSAWSSEGVRRADALRAQRLRRVCSPMRRTPSPAPLTLGKISSPHTGGPSPRSTSGSDEPSPVRFAGDAAVEGATLFRPLSFDPLNPEVN